MAVLTSPNPRDDQPAGCDHVRDQRYGGRAPIVDPVKSPAIKTGASAINEIEVATKGNTGAFYVNGAKVTDFHGQAPSDGGPPGVYAESGPSITTWVFSRVQIYSYSP